MYQSIKKLFLKIWFWKKHYRLNRINKKLEIALKKEIRQRSKLKIDIITFVRKYLKLDAGQSIYIPIDYKSREEIRSIVEANYGENMRKLNIRLNSKLQIV